MELHASGNPSTGRGFGFVRAVANRRGRLQSERQFLMSLPGRTAQRRKFALGKVRAHRDGRPEGTENPNFRVVELTQEHLFGVRVKPQDGMKMRVRSMHALVEGH